MLIIVIIAVSLIAFEVGFRAGYADRGKKLKSSNTPKSSTQSEEYHNFLSYNGDIQ